MKKIIELQLKTYYDYIYKRSLYLKQNKSIYIYLCDRHYYYYYISQFNSSSILKY